MHGKAKHADMELLLGSIASKAIRPFAQRLADAEGHAVASASKMLSTGWCNAQQAASIVMCQAVSCQEVFDIVPKGQQLAIQGPNGMLVVVFDDWAEQLPQTMDHTQIIVGDELDMLSNGS